VIARLVLAAPLVVLAADLGRGGDAVACSAAPGRDAYWSWREIDGRRCYYAGRPGKPKTELYWRSVGPSRAAPVRAGQPEAARDAAGPEAVPDPPPISVSERQSSPTEEPEWQATMEDQLLAFTCCWPELLPTANPSVERNGTPLKVQDRYEPITMPTATMPARPLWPFMLLMVGLVAGSILLAKRRLT
jgi:hypothetical protein